MSIIPGSFPDMDHDASASVSANQNYMLDRSIYMRELDMNSLHTRKLRSKKLGKECFKLFDVVLIIQIIIVYLIDNSIIKLCLRYALQYFLLNLNNILDELLVMNEQTLTNNIEEINARDSLNALINNLKSRYKFSLQLGLLLFNAFCIVSHFYTLPLAEFEYDYLYGFCFINIVGQLKTHTVYPIIVLDVAILFQQYLLYNFKFNNLIAESHEQDDEDTDAIDDDDDTVVLDDGYQGDLKIYEVDMLPKLNKNFLVELIGWDIGYRLGSGNTYGSV